MAARRLAGTPRSLVSLLAALLMLALVSPATTASAASPAASPEAAAPSGAATASGFLFYKYPLPQPACTGSALNVSSNPFYTREDCGFAVFTLSEAATTVKVELYAADATEPFTTLDTTKRSKPNEYSVGIKPDNTWPAGEIRMVVVADSAKAGEAQFGHNLLGANVAAAKTSYAPGDDITVNGNVHELDATANTGATKTGVPATFDLRLVMADGTVLGSVDGVTAEENGDFSKTIPGTFTKDLKAGAESGYQLTLAAEAVNAKYQDPDQGEFAAQRAGAGSVPISTPPTGLIVENSFVSAVGWVKPGDTYPSRVFVRNLTDRAFNDVSVTVAAAPSSRFTQTSPGSPAATISTDKKTITWTIGTIAAGNVSTLVIESKAATTRQDPRIVWKDLSSTATLTADGTTSTSRSHGPKVIPQSTIYDTARYGDRPFPVVPVDYRDRKHQPDNSGDELANKINSPSVAGSTFNLFQEMSLGQLFPNGTVPSTGIATRGFGDKEYDFTSPEPQGTCHGVTVGNEGKNTPLYPERIKDGFYQLPGDTDYYGDDKFGSAVVGSQVPGPLFDIDSACGPTGKLVYDSATIADPEIDYSDYDTDKDGVVDFFMVVYAGCGGNGASQLSTLGCPYDTVPYDNVWPHSSSLEFYYTDPETGLTGYISDDQLKNLEGEKLYYTDASRSQMTTEVTDFKVFVRVGPYNVNPETAIDNASVISHEYGHSLGLPDFYSLGGRETYGDWNLMATDKSQNMDIFSRQEMGWVVPEVLKPGTSPSVQGWTDSKQDTHTIQWQTRDGTPYTLQGPNVHNAQAYVAKLPGRQLIDPAKFDTGDKASKTHAWWSGSGNDFGCPPDGGHNLDVIIPGAGDLPPGTPLKLEFKSLWDIEWDFDYGFVLTSNNGGEEYISHESEKGYTTERSQNPNGNSCQLKYGNGITGSSGSYQNNTAATDRVLGNYPPSVFLADRYDITDLSGVDNGVLRFSYSTDPGLARPGWFIDDMKVTATLDSGEEVLLDANLEDDAEGGPDSPFFYNGGCKDDSSTASQCTTGWNYIASDAEAPADHAYYLEMRDRSGFDLEGKGENDRDPIAFAPGLSLVYTDEAHGYGNVGTDNPPAQSPLDSQPAPTNDDRDTPDLSDAAWTAAAGDKSFTDTGIGHTDNYHDPAEKSTDPRYPDVDNPWRFQYDCLTFDVASMAGNEVGPEESNGDLTGDVNFTMGNGCGKFDYGYVEQDPPPPPANTAPVAQATAQPKRVHDGRSITFDASGSTDAETPDDLDYVWNMDDGGVDKDAVGETVEFKYAEAGVYNATVTVTDPRGETDTASVRVTVVDDIQCSRDAVARTGGWRLIHDHDSTAEKGHYCDNLPNGTAGDTMRLRFTGPQVDLHYGKSTSGGTAQVFIDGQQVRQVSFTGRAAEPRFRFNEPFRKLGGGTHVIRLVVDPPQDGKRLAYVDSFIIAGQVR